MMHTFAALLLRSLPKVAGIVRAVDVADYQQVHKGDLLVELQDDDYRA